MLLLVLCPGTPGGSTGNGSGFKASRGKWLEVSSDRLGELGIMCLWPCSLAVPVLAGWVCVYGGSMSRNSRGLNRQWFWF